MLMKCLECGGVVSDKAVACPHCGAPVEKVKSSSEVESRQEEETSQGLVSQGEPVQDERQAETTCDNASGVLEADSTEYDDSLGFLKYFFEFLAAVAWTGVSFVILAVVSGAILPKIFNSYQLGFLVGFALSPIYFVWPIEWMVCKWNTCRAGHVVGNILLVLISLFVIMAIVGGGFDKSILNGGGMVENIGLTGIIPLVVLFGCIGILVSHRKNVDRKAMSKASLSAGAKLLSQADDAIWQDEGNLSDDERARLVVDFKGCTYAIVVLYELYSMREVKPSNREEEFNLRYSELSAIVHDFGGECVADSFQYFVGLYLPNRRYSDVGNIEDYELAKIVPEMAEAFGARNQSLNVAQMRNAMLKILESAKSVAADSAIQYPYELASFNNFDFVIDKCFGRRDKEG